MVGDVGPIQRRGWARAPERLIRWDNGVMHFPPWWPLAIPVYVQMSPAGTAGRARIGWTYIPAVVTLALARVGRSKHEGVVRQIAAYGLERLAFVYTAGGDAAVNAVLDAG